MGGSTPTRPLLTGGVRNVMCSHLLGCLAGCLAPYLLGCLACSGLPGFRLAGYLLDTAWLAGCLAGCLFACLLAWLHFITGGVGEPGNQPLNRSRLTLVQRKRSQDITQVKKNDRCQAKMLIQECLKRYFHELHGSLDTDWVDQVRVQTPPGRPL